MTFGGLRAVIGQPLDSGLYVILPIRVSSVAHGAGGVNRQSSRLIVHDQD